MRTLLTLGSIACILSLSACALAPKTKPAEAVAAAKPASKPAEFKIEKVEFNTGVSSATVEKMAKKANCQSNLGAGLLTPKGPVEIYRVECDNGKVFMARCELRQCAPMQR